jgi:hypothetical protein
MDRYRGPKTSLNIALPMRVYLAIIMNQYGGSKTAFTGAFLACLCLSIIMYRYRGTKTDLTIALPRGLYIAIIMDCYGGPKSNLTIA